MLPPTLRYRQPEIVRRIACALLALSLAGGQAQADGWCRPGNSRLCVIDGDTFVMDGERIRIANIDAPELRRAQCGARRRLAIVARSQLAELLESGPVVIMPGHPATGRLRDRNGRALALIRVRGREVGEAMIKANLARPWAVRCGSWCQPFVKG